MPLGEPPFQSIAQAIGTPYYCYNAIDIRRHFRQLSDALPHGIDYFYSVKANPNKSIVEILHAEGAGCEVCSLAELETAVAARVPPKDIIFVGPAKSIDELTRCVELNIKAVIVESLTELELVDKIASDRGEVQQIALRVNPSFKPGASKLVMSGKPTQFGIDEDELEQAKATLKFCKHLELVGLHAYMGTRLLKVSAIRENTANILDIAIRMKDMMARPLAFVDVGGGFGVNYFDGEPELDLPTLGVEMGHIVAKFRKYCPTTRIVIELGRYLVARSGVFVTAVRYIKKSKGKLFAICDGGSNCNAAAAGLGSLFRRNFPIARLNGERSGHATYTLTGPLCTPTDVIGEDVTLNTLEIGSLVGIFHSGAYGPSASPVQFLGFGHPAEIIVDGGMLMLIRHRDTPEDLLARQVVVLLDKHVSPGERSIPLAEDL